MFVGICVDSVLRTQNGTHSDVEVAVKSILKYAPDRKGGGGRTATSDHWQTIVLQLTVSVLLGALQSSHCL